MCRKSFTFIQSEDVQHFEVGIAFFSFEIKNITFLHTGPGPCTLLLPHVYSGEVPPRLAVLAAAELAQHHSKGAVSQAHDCLSAGKRAVCAM